MPPKGGTRKRRAKNSEDDARLEHIEQLFLKYRHMEADETEDPSAVGMFEEEHPTISVASLPNMSAELQLAWDAAVLAILTAEQTDAGRIDLTTTKTVFDTLQVATEQHGDMDYVFATLCDQESQLITCDSLARGLRHLSLRESADKMGLLLAFAHEQSFLRLILNEQMHGRPAADFACKEGVDFAKFKRTFIRSTFLATTK